MLSQNPRIAKRYAKALLALAMENHIAGKAYEDMTLINQVFLFSKELQILMRSPIIRVGKKQRILKSLFDTHLHPLIFQYLSIIVRKQRAALLPGIARAFLQVYKEARGIELVRVTTASAMDESLRKRSMEVAKQLTPLTIEFQENVDPGIIGGFILNLGERQYDASVKSRLAQLKKHLKLQ